MLHCTSKNAAMQTNPLLWHLVYNKPLSSIEAASAAPANQRVQMSKTATVALPASNTLFSRLLANIDRLLMTNAEIAIRNGDLPRAGL